MPLASERVNRKLATVLFDSSSDRACVTPEFVRRVKPRHMKQTSVSFATFRSRSHYSKTKLYRISMKGLNNSEEVTVELPELPVICVPLRKLKINSRSREEFETWT